MNNLGDSINDVRDITTDNVGNIYVLGYNADIFKFNQAGFYLETLDLPPSEYGSMKILASDSLGNIYYDLRTPESGFQINKILPNGNVITVVEDQNLSCLADIEIDYTGNIYVANSSGCIDNSSAKYDPSGELLFKFETNPKPEHQNLKQIKISVNGKIYALQNLSWDILLFRDKFVEDNVPPVITPIDDIIIETHSSTGSVATFSTNAVDAIDGAMDVTCSPESGAVFPLGATIPVTCTSEDYSYNSSFVTFNVNIVSPPSPTISSTSPPTDSNTTVEGNNLDSKIFATGTVQNLIPGITTVSTTWKNPGGETVYQSNLQLDASGNFNNEFDNPMYVRDMKDSGLYTTIVTYDDVTTQYTWNYVSTVYAAQQAAAQAVIDAAAAEAAAAEAAAQAAADAAAAQAAADAAAAQAAADAAQAAINLASQPVVTNTIVTVDESGFSQSCVDTGCYTPLTAVVNYGDTVTMTNTDPTGVHTYTSGTVNGFSPTPSGTFDSGVMMSGESFQWQANVSGEVPYYCMLHTWMVGTIVVQGSGPVVEPTPEPTPEPVVDTSNDQLTVSGSITNYTYDDSLVTIQIFSSNGNIVEIAQISIDSNGYFTFTSTREGSLWNQGQHTIKVTWKDLSSESSFNNELGTGQISRNIILQNNVIPEPTTELQYGIFSVEGVITNYNESPSDVTIRVESPNGSNTVAVDQVTPNSNGEFSTQFNVSNWIDNGYYTILVGYGSQQKEMYVLVEGGMNDGITKRISFVNNIVSTPEPVSLIDLDISMSKTTYDLGDLVGFSISGNDFSGTQNVSVDVTDPTGNTVISRSINISPNTSGEIEFRLSENFKTGTYKITTTTSDNGQIISETSDFKLQSQFNSFTISGLTVSDQQGNSSTLQAGEMGFIKVNLSSTKAIATLVTVNLFDSELTSIGIGSVQTTLASGESEIILSFMIPDDAAIGPADIYVNAFSDWPSNGGTALTGELSSMEDIS